jgi:hypothetical protein
MKNNIKLNYSGFIINRFNDLNNLVADFVYDDFLFTNSSKNIQGILDYRDLYNSEKWNYVNNLIETNSTITIPNIKKQVSINICYVKIPKIYSKFWKNIESVTCTIVQFNLFSKKFGKKCFFIKN